MCQGIDEREYHCSSMNNHVRTLNRYLFVIYLTTEIYLHSFKNGKHETYALTLLCSLTFILFHFLFLFVFLTKADVALVEYVYLSVWLLPWIRLLSFSAVC